MICVVCRRRLLSIFFCPTSLKYCPCCPSHSPTLRELKLSFRSTSKYFKKNRNLLICNSSWVVVTGHRQSLSSPPSPSVTSAKFEKKDFGQNIFNIGFIGKFKTLAAKCQCYKTQENENYKNDFSVKKFDCI